MGKGLSGGGVNRYGEFLDLELKEAILRYNGLAGTLTHENVVVGLGSTETLFMAADAFLSPEIPFMTEWPTYYVILDRAAQNRSEIVKVPLLDGWVPDLDGMAAEAARARREGRPYGLVHLNVINNPMGTFLRKDTFDAFARALYQASPETVLLCDDSDPEFMEPRFQPHMFQALEHVVPGYPMLHVQTFSHTFGLTGLRIGYAIAPREIIRRMEEHKIFSGVNVLGSAAARASLEHADEQIRRVNRLCTESRDDLYPQLDALGLRHEPSQGHYIMIDLADLNGTLAVLQMYLNHQVFVRWGMDWEMDNWIRVNPGTEWENARFIQALRWLLDNGRRFRGADGREALAGSEGRRLAASALRAGFPGAMLARARSGGCLHPGRLLR